MIENRPLLNFVSHALLMLGVHPPAELTELLSRAVHQLSGTG